MYTRQSQADSHLSLGGGAAQSGLLKTVLLQCKIQRATRFSTLVPIDKVRLFVFWGLFLNVDQLTTQLVDWLKSCGNVKEFIDLFNSLQNPSTVGDHDEGFLGGFWGIRTSWIFRCLISFCSFSLFKSLVWVSTFVQRPLYVVFLWGDIILIINDSLCVMVKSADDAEFVDEQMNTWNQSLNVVTRRLSHHLPINTNSTSDSLQLPEEVQWDWTKICHSKRSVQYLIYNSILYSPTGWTITYINIEEIFMPQIFIVVWME